MKELKIFCPLNIKKKAKQQLTQCENKIEELNVVG